ncbi:E3 ubiquitin-protein ligase HTD3 [Phytophthora pseudosyringae]|uniref:E3 ubiquitin-protein ligase HTD3 n=1 Tax=Phytophthora pseudosyringae TaxID=221518 RepID=A0A8T1VXQ9_9STRA|nr:E3 ubiquitin-protein ligase HTD3 [Phytophthora pseudosyringae]
MYIGPWQEYRLAKIQDDAIQRLRQEWEAQLRGQLPPGDDDRIRELMQPLMAKMPSLLLAAKSRTGSGVRNGRSTGSRSAVNSEAGSRCSSRPVSARSNASSSSVRTRTSSSDTREAADVVRRRSKPRGENNQETHDESSMRAPFVPPKPKKKGKKAPLSALAQVQKRKKMFAKWIKEAGNGGDNPGQPAQEAKPEITTEVAENSTVTRLPPIHSAVPASAAALIGENTKPKAFSSLTLPPLHQLSVSMEVPPNAHVTAMSPRASASSNADDIDLDESVDEEEVNNLLNWTDTLLSPQAMDSLCAFDD